MQINRDNTHDADRLRDTLRGQQRQGVGGDVQEVCPDGLQLVSHQVPREEEIWHKSLATGCYFIKNGRISKKSGPQMLQHAFFV